MKQAHYPPPFLLIIIIVVAAVFITSSFHVFKTAHAAPSLPASAGLYENSDYATTPIGMVQPTLTPSAAVTVYGDTSGVIALAGVIVLTVLVGAMWGLRRSIPAKKAR